MHLKTLPDSLRPPRVLVIGAGVGGLCAAALLARAGHEVQLLERAATPGGKLRQVAAGPTLLDGGPTVLTMRWVFDQLFEQLGLNLDDHLPLRRCELLARHAWGPGEQLDLHPDLEHSVAAIRAFSSPAEAERYRQFCTRAREVYTTLEQPFIRSSRPNPFSLTWRVGRQQGWAGLGRLLRISPFTTLWQALSHYFHDPRLRQLFGRYATYCGTSPFAAPATLMLVAHVEREAVWQIDGGLYRLAEVLARTAQRQGAQLRYGCEVAEVLLAGGRVSGVRLADGETLAADAVVFNGDARALHTGLLGEPLRRALGEPAAAQPSLSALTWHVQARATGFDLAHHNVFFSPPGAYGAEFDAIAAGRLPEVPTVYVCAQDRCGPGAPADERLMCLVNAPAGTAQHAPLTDSEIARCQDQMWARLQQAGLTVTPTGPPARLTTPQDFARLFPATGGALYGPASQGWRASFQARPAGLTRVPGLLLAGGSVHPGPGLPMAALSGQWAARQLNAALRSTSRSVAVAMPGGISTP